MPHVQCLALEVSSLFFLCPLLDLQKNCDTYWYQIAAALNLKERASAALNAKGKGRPPLQIDKYTQTVNIICSRTAATTANNYSLNPQPTAHEYPSDLQAAIATGIYNQPFEARTQQY